MVSPGSFSEEGLVVCELLLVGERDTVNSLKGIIVLIAKEVRSRILGSSSGQNHLSTPTMYLRTHLGDHEGLDLARMWDVGADTQIDHGATAINRGGSAVRYLGLDDILLVFVVLKCRCEGPHFMVQLALSSLQTSSRASPLALQFVRTFVSP